jgi:hypothetical protein
MMPQGAEHLIELVLRRSNKVDPDDLGATRWSNRSNLHNDFDSGPTSRISSSRL